MKKEKKSWIAGLLSMVDTWGEVAVLVLIVLAARAELTGADLERVKLLWDYTLYMVIAVGGVKAVPPGSLNFSKKK